MNQLAKLIQNLGIADKSAREIVEILNEKNIKLPVPGKVTYATLADKFGKDVVSSVDAALQRAGMEWIRMTLAGSGVDFSNPQTQDAIDSLASAGIIPAELAEQAKALGYEKISLCEQFGLPPATEDAVIAALSGGPPVPDGKTVSANIVLGVDKTSVMIIVQPTSKGEPVGDPEVYAWSSSMPMEGKYADIASALVDVVERVRAWPSS